MIDNKLKFYRHQLGLNQQELANRLKVSRETISRLESGKNIPGLELAFIISEYFRVAIEDIWSHEEKTMIQ